MKKNKLLIALGLLAGLQMTHAAVVSQYAYDALGRLTSVSNAQDVATEAYAYDGVGNIVEKTIDGKTYRLSYDAAHQLQAAEGPDGRHEFVYDKAGRLVKEVLNGEPTARYTYGYLDKVIAVERNGEVTRFDYDASGMLVGKQLPDGSYERWTWDGMALVARGEERYINESHITGGLPLVSETSEGVLYHQHDHLGTTVASYTVDGEVAKTYAATVYGQGELENSPSARFTGKPYDADLGAYVFPFRNYNPEAARWLSADPAGFPDGPNNHFYAAVPTMGVDPWGLALLDEPNIPGATGWNKGGIRQFTYVKREYQYRWNPTGWAEPGIAKTSGVGKALSASKTIGYSNTQKKKIGGKIGDDYVEVTFGISAADTNSYSSTEPLSWEAIPGYSVTGSVLMAEVNLETRGRIQIWTIADGWGDWSEWSSSSVLSSGVLSSWTGVRYTEQ